MNAITTPPAKAPVPHATARFKWLLRREYWENRGGFFWGPVIAGAIIVGLNLILAVIGSIAARRSMGSSGFVFDHADTHEVGQALGAMGDGMLVGGVIVACIVLAFVVFFYALGCLYDDRRDRSILFWKSLPVSDGQMVLSKLAWALVLAPVLAVAIGLLIGLALWLISALTITVNGVPAAHAVFTQSHPLRIIGGVLACLPVYMAWALPTIGWLSRWNPRRRSYVLASASRDGGLAAAAAEAVGFREYEGRHVGVMVTPWFMNLTVLPSAEDLKVWVAGGTTRLAFPSGVYDFVVNDLHDVGLIGTCSLFSTMLEFTDHEAAQLAAQTVADAVFEPEQPAPAPTVSRRQLLGG